MDRGSREHQYIELVGGPMDGRLFKESEGKVSHLAGDQYKFGDSLYSPWKVESKNGVNVLKLRYRGKFKG